MKHWRFVLRWAAAGFTAFMLLVAPAKLPAQTQTGPIAMASRGIVPNGSYSISDIETVDGVSGNVSIHIPLSTLPSGPGGSSEGLSLIYNSSIYVWLGLQLDRADNWDINDSGGWRYAFNYGLIVDTYPNPGGAQDVTAFRYRMMMPDGSSHIFYISSGDLGVNGYEDGSGYYAYNDPPAGIHIEPGDKILYSADGSYLQLVTSGTFNTRTWTLKFPDGRVVTGVGTTTTSIADRNGNTISINNYSATSTSDAMTVLSDGLGRTITIDYQAGQDVITQAGYNNQTLTWTVTWTIVTLTGPHIYGGPYDCQPYPNCDADGATFRVVQSISFPNGLIHQFSYDGSVHSDGSKAWGQLSGMTLPSGAAVAYSYPSQPAGGAGSVLQIFPLSSKTLTWTDEDSSPAISRQESSSYSFTDSNSVITKADGGQIKRYFSPNALPSNYPTGMVYRTETRDSGQNLTSTTETVWGLNPAYAIGASPLAPFHLPGNPVSMIKIDTAVNSGSVTLAVAKSYVYDRNGNQTQISETDWVPYSNVIHDSNSVPTGVSGTTTLRTTQNAFVNGTTTTAAGNIDDPNGYWNSQPVQLLNLVASTTVTGVGPGSVSEFQYDSGTLSHGNLTQLSEFDSTTSTYLNTNNTYDSYGNLLTTQNPRGFTTQYTYGSACWSGPAMSNLYPTQIVQAYGTADARTFAFTWDCYAGVKRTDYDQDHPLLRTFGYDQFGRNSSVQEGSTRLTTNVYSDAARTIEVLRDRLNFNETTGQLTEIRYFDQLGRVRLSQDAAGNFVQHRYLTPANTGVSYELVSNTYVAQAGSNPPAPNSDATVGWTVTTRDSVGRVTRVEHFSGASLPAPWGSNSASTGAVTTTYSANCSTTTDEAGVSRTHCTDGLGRLTSVAENGIGATTTYGYDALDDLVFVTQGSTARNFTYSSLKRLISGTNPETGPISYGYDGNGNLTSRTDARNITTTFTTYNGLDQVTGKSYSDGTPSVNYSYDKSRLIQVSSSVSSYNYTSFDELGRVTGANQTTGTSYGFTQHYYPFMGVKDITYPGSNRTLTTGYDTGGRPATVSGQIGANPATNYVTATNYAAHGEISSLALGNSQTETRQYNARLQPTQIQVGTLFTLANRYDPSAGSDLNCTGTSITVPGNNGNMLAQTVNGLARNYSYDGANRICWAAQGSTWIQGYGSDTRGNLAFITWTGQLPNQTADVITSTGVYTANNRVSGWAYDLAGNLSGIPSAGGTTVRAPCAANVMPGVAMMRTACYDAENRMISETDANGTTATYAYDGDGRRVSRTLNGVTTTFIYDPDGQLAQDYGGPTIPLSETGTRYVTTDQLGTTRLLTKADGTAAETYDYLPFGMEFAQSADTNRIRFTGKERDSETGLDYFGARYFSAAQGRWTSPDWSATPQPIPYADLSDPQTLNLYSYVRNNPLSHADIDGHIDCNGNNAQLIGCVAIADWNAAHGIGEKVKAATSTALNAVGHGMEKVSDFLNTAPGVGLALGMVLFAETGGGEETPAVAEAAEEVEAAVSKGASLVKKPVNLPSWDKIAVDMKHVAERHMPGGPYTDGRDVFLNLNYNGVLRAIRQAYGAATAVSVEGERVLLQGITKTGMTVQMWFNKTEKVIETAYPVGKQW